MKRGVTIASIILVILLIVWASYYFLIKKPQDERIGIKGTNGGGGANDPVIPPTPVFNAGDNVYLKTDQSAWAANHGIPVYGQPVADTIGSYLVGVVRGDWYAGNSIGKVLQTKPGWVEVNVNDMQIWKYSVSGGYSTVIGKLTGPYWFSDKAIYKL